MSKTKKNSQFIEVGLRDLFYALIIVMIAVSSLMHIARTENKCSYDPYANLTPTLTTNFCCYEPDCEESYNNPETCHCIYTQDCTPVTWEEVE